MHHRGYFNGLRLVPHGLGLIFRPGVRRFVFVPFFINMMLFGSAIWFGYQSLARILDNVSRWLPGWLDWLVNLIWPLIILMVMIAIYYTFTLVANLIAAPFNSLLAEKIEDMLRGQPTGTGTGFAKIPEILGRTLWSEIRKLAYQVKWLIFLIILSFIPGLNLIAPFAWFYFSAWMLAVNYVDYPMGNHDMYFRDVKRQLKSDRMTALGIGTGLVLLTLIPGLNFLAMPAGVASGTLYWVKSENQSQRSPPLQSS